MLKAPGLQLAAPDLLGFRLKLLCDICNDDVHRMSVNNMDFGLSRVCGEALIDNHDLSLSCRGLALEEAILADEPKRLRGGTQAPTILL